LALAAASAVANVRLAMRTRRTAVGPLLAPALALGLAFLALALSPQPAGAATQIESFAFDASTPQAGAHADLSASFSLASTDQSEVAKSVLLNTPSGFFVNPAATPRCTSADFALNQCSPAAQAGLITIRAKHEGDPDSLLGTASVYALAPGATETARFGFVAPTVDIPVTIPVSVRTGADYGLTLSLQNLPQSVPLAGAQIDLWAVPADTSHDAERFPAGSVGNPPGCPGLADAGCLVGPTASAAPQMPLLVNPTACPGGALSSTLTVDTYEDPGDFVTTAATSLPSTGCNQLVFSPGLDADLTTTATSTPTGLDLGLKTFNEGLLNPSGLSSAAIESLVVTLPPGLAVDPDVDGQDACALADFASPSPPGCPGDSKVGSFVIGAPGFGGSLEGDAYFGEPESAGMYRLFLVASGFGMDVKLVAPLRPSPEAGRLALSLSGLPPVPFDAYLLKLASGAGLLVTPPQCGDHPVNAVVGSWNSSLDFTLQRQLTLDSGPGGGACPGPATDVSVSLSPSSLLAGSDSTSVATVTVTDASELGVAGDQLVLSSTDGDEQIGPVTDNGDGTYTATIRSPTAIGAQTITATDLSTDPPIAGSATLLQLGEERTTPAPASTPPPIATSPPVVLRLTGKTPHRTRDRTPTIRFAAEPSGSSFSCKLDRRRFQPCTSPTTLPRLGPGKHTFQVRTADSKTIAYRFVVLR